MLLVSEQEVRDLYNELLDIHEHGQVNLKKAKERTASWSGEERLQHEYWQDLEMICKGYVLATKACLELVLDKLGEYITEVEPNDI